MAARTEPGGPAPCPVCGEPLDGRPERCFRCETPLARWWGFEEALATVGQGAAHVPSPPGAASQRRVAMVSVLAVAAVLVGGGAGFWLGPGHAEEVAAPPSTAAPAPPVPAPAPSAARTQVIRYRVQRGDSLWRIAASLAGDGRRWRELFPEQANAAAPIAVGSVLEVDLAAPPP